jgi:hypothetical protein
VTLARTVYCCSVSCFDVLVRACLGEEPLETKNTVCDFRGKSFGVYRVVLYNVNKSTGFAISCEVGETLEDRLPLATEPNEGESRGNKNFKYDPK